MCHTKSRRARGSLRLESLDDRACPCATGQIGETLFITGDRTADRIDLKQSGDQVLVACDDEPEQTFTGVFHIVVNTWAGDDAIIFDYEPGESGEPFPMRRLWDIDTGTGNDQVAVTLTPGPTDDVVFHVNLGAGNDSLKQNVAQKVDIETPAGGIVVDVQGGAGDDQFDVAVGELDTVSQPHLFSSVAVAINAGAGANEVGFSIINSRLLGSVDLAVATGAGADKVGISIEGSTSLGSVNLSCTTGLGNDTIDLTSKKWEFDASVAVGIDTGTGDDRLTATLQHAAEPEFTFRAHLGAGNDSFEATYKPTQSAAPPSSDLPPGPCKLDVFGQLGNDHLSLFVVGPDTRPEQQLFNTALTANLDGGLGNDTASFEIKDLVVNAPMSLSFDGGLGSDFFGGKWQDVTVSAAMSQSIDLGGGNDIAMYDVFNVAFDAPVTQTINLGGGNDIAMYDVFNVAINADVVTNIMGGLDPDTIYVTCGGTTLAVGASLAVSADGGGGADTVGFIWIENNVGPGASLMVDVDGGGGADTIAVTAVGCTVARDARFDVEVHGGDGADVLQLAGVGLLVESDGGMEWCQDGGDDNDVVDTRIDLDPNSQGKVDVEVMGSAGDDDLTLVVGGFSDPWLLNALVDGGDGYDVAHVTRGAPVKNCEEVFVLD